MQSLILLYFFSIKNVSIRELFKENKSKLKFYEIYRKILAKNSTIFANFT